MEDIWLPLLIRMAVTAAVVVAATAAAERVGPLWAALIGAFPTSAGPAYVMLALKEDAAFVAASAVTSMASMIAIAPFTVAVTLLGPRTNVVVTILGGLLVWAAFAVPVTLLSWTPMTALAASIVVYGICFALTRHVTYDAVMPKGRAAGWYELPLRAFVVGLFVAVVVTLSGQLGPVGTGLGAVFPIVFISLTAVLHIRMGGIAVAMTMRNALRVVSGMVFALMMLHYGVVWWGEAWGLSASLAVSILWATAFVVFNRMRMSVRPA